MKVSKTVRPFSALVCGGLVISALAFGVGCKGSDPAPTKSANLTGLLPAKTIGFFTGDFQNADIRTFLLSEEYRAYIDGIRSATEKNKEATGDFTAYWEVLQAVGLVAAQGDTNRPIGAAIFFAAVGENKSIDLGAYYDLVPGTDGKALLAKAKEALARAKIVSEPVSGPSYEGITVKLFGSGGEVPPALAVYRDTLKLDVVYAAANESRIVFATTKSGLDRGFAPAKDEAKAILESEDFKKVISSAGGTTEFPMYGMLDVKLVAEALASDPSEIKDLPLSLLGITSGFKEKTIVGNLAALVTPKTPEQEKGFTALVGSSAAPLLANLSATTAFAFSIDGGVLKRTVEAFGAEIPDGERAKVFALLGKIQALSIGVAPATSTLPYPDLTLSFASSDTDGLVSAIKAFMAEGPLPPGMELKSGTVEGIAVESLPTPLGIKIHLAKDAKHVVIASGDGALIAAMKDGGGIGSGAAYKAVAARLKSPVVALVVDYPKFGSILEAGMQAVAMFAPQGSALPESSYEQFKHMGRISIGVAYVPGVASVSFGQDLAKTE
jgi:hypothetical protein